MPKGLRIVFHYISKSISYWETISGPVCQITYKNGTVE